MTTTRPRVLYVRTVAYPVGHCLECKAVLQGPDATRLIRAHCRDNPGHLVAAQQVTRTDYWAES